MLGQKQRKRKSRSRAAIQKADEKRRAEKAETLRRRARTPENPFVYRVTDEAYARPTSGGQEHSPPKVTDDLVQKYEKSLISPQALATLIKRGDLKPTAARPPIRPQKRVQTAIAPRRTLKPVKVTRPPARPVGNRSLCIWRDSRDHLHRLLTWSDVFPQHANALSRGTWTLAERMPAALGDDREKYLNRAKAMTELGKAGYYEFRIPAPAMQ